MWNYEKRLQYPVKITKTNPKMAQVIISQFGGPDGELAASMRYLSQRYTTPYKEVKGILTDIGTSWIEMFHLLKMRTSLVMMGFFYTPFLTKIGLKNGTASLMITKINSLIKSVVKRLYGQLTFTYPQQ